LKRSFCIILTVIFTVGFHSNAQQPIWQNLGIEQGLPDPNVTSLLKAGDGKLYIGTAIGLYSYDGFSFKKIELSSGKKLNPYINSMISDGNMLYIGSRDAVIRYNLKTYQTDVIFNPLNSISGALNLCFGKSLNSLYVFCHKGLLIIDKSSESFKATDSLINSKILRFRVVSDGEVQAFCASKEIISIKKDGETVLFKDKNIFDAQWWENENSWLIIKNDGLFLLDTNYLSLKKLDIPLKINQVENHWLYPDQNGGFWIKSAGHFVYLKSAHEKSVEHFENVPGNSYSFTSNTAQSFFTEPVGTRWVGGDGTGLGYLTPNAGKINFMSNEQAGVQHFWCFRYEEVENKLLCGTTAGILEGRLINGTFENIKQYIPEGFDRFSVNSIVGLNENEYLISVYRAGFWTFNKHTHQFKQLRNLNNEIGTLFVFGIKEVSGGRFVLYTQNNAFILDKNSLKLTRFSQPVFHNYSIFTVMEDCRGQFLIAGGFGLQVFDSQLDQVRYFAKTEDSIHSVAANVIFDIYETEPGKYLLATMGAGLCYYSEIDTTFSAVKLATDPDNIFGIIQSGKNTVVLTTSNGICSYNLQTKESLMLNKSNVLPFNDFNQSAFYRDREYTLLGGDKGMLIIKSKDLDSLFNLQSEIIIRNDDKSIESLVLEAGEHAFQLEFSLTDILPFAKQSFRYRILPLDTEWQTLQRGQNILTYNYIPPGKYILEVETEDNTALYKTGKKDISVIVKPYFYQTIWFRIIFLFLISGILFIVIRYFSLLRLRWKLNRMDAERKILYERSRISRELHDNLGSQLTYIISGLEMTELLLKRNNAEKTAKNLEKLQLAARESMQQLRDSIWALKPGEMTLNSLSSQCEKWFYRITESFNIHVSFSKGECPDYKIDPITGLNIFRIFQEAVHNSLKHSEATELIAKIECNEVSIDITITDNGKGFANRNEEGNGLASMKQRAESVHALLTIETATDKGTKVWVKIDKNMLKG